MSLKECYAVLGGDYDGVVSRFHGERLVQKFALKFLADGSYQLLQDSLDAQNYEEAFRAAHTIKGVCQNLSITDLGRSSSALTESLRGGWTPEAAGLADQVKADYERTVQAIRAFQEGLEG